MIMQLQRATPQLDNAPRARPVVVLSTLQACANDYDSVAIYAEYERELLQIYINHRSDSATLETLNQVSCMKY